MNKIYTFALLFLMPIACKAQNQNSTSAYTLVTYNVENLFDGDGTAIYDDYNTTDKDGNDLYTKEDILTKVKNAVRVLKQYNNGKGPDIAVIVELESDYSPAQKGTKKLSYSEFLAKYSNTTLDKMLGAEFNAEVADLPSDYLLLKGMQDAGMWDYELASGDSPKSSKGQPTTVQKTAVYSRFPIITEKTKIHPLHRARPILETWINVDGNELAVFANHWKSGASSAEMEEIRVQNAKVLRTRLNELIKENEFVDFVLAGDFNSDYNQKARYNFKTSAVNDVLKSVGDEGEFFHKDGTEVYNLWYEAPINERGSDTYRGFWGTLMQIMVSKGMYDQRGVYYVDNTLERGDFGFNTFSSSGEPKRWSSTFSGSGYSDHLPISMQFSVGEQSDSTDPIFIQSDSFSSNDDDEWKPISVEYNIPTEFFTIEDFMKEDPTKSAKYYGAYFYLPATVNAKYDLVVNGKTFDMYAPSFNPKEVLEEVKNSGKEIMFYGRFSQYRGNWQFIVESPDFLVIE